MNGLSPSEWDWKGSEDDARAFVDSVAWYISYFVVACSLERNILWKDPLQAQWRIRSIPWNGVPGKVVVEGHKMGRILPFAAYQGIVRSNGRDLWGLSKQ